MKPSNNALFSYVLGAVAAIGGTVITVINEDFIAITLGIATCALLWTMGIQSDLYRRWNTQDE